MKPMGGKKTLIENNCQDWKVKGKLYKKYKRQERQKAKKDIKKEVGCCTEYFRCSIHDTPENRNQMDFLPIKRKR